MTTTPTASSDLDQRQDRLPVPLATVAGRIGAIFVTALGIAHAIVNTMGFAQAGYQPWSEYLTFGLGLSVVCFLLAFGAWTIAGSRRPRWPVAVLVGLGGLLLLVQLVGIVITDPMLVPRPLGPGPWSLVAGPAMVIEAIALAVRWIGARSPRALR